MMKRFDFTARLGLLVGFAVSVFVSQAPNAAAQWQDPKKVEAAFAAATVVVVGRQPKKQEWNLLIEVANKNPKLRDEFLEGVNFGNAVKGLKLHLAESNGASLRAELINNAFREVHGRDSTAVEQAAWDAQVRAQKAWYATVVAAEIENLSKNNTLRTAMINRVYQTAMGRDADATNLKFWLPRAEHYRPMVEANRKWLYSPNGAQDLADTVRRALKTVPGQKADEPVVKAAMTQFSSSRMIYSEMLKYLNSPK